MKLVTAVVKPHQLDDLRAAVQAAGVRGMTVTEAQGSGGQRGQTEVYRGDEYVADLLPRVRVEVLVDGVDADPVVEAIVSAAHTGKIGDAKVWITDVGRLLRIRTGEVGEEAL